MAKQSWAAPGGEVEVLISTGKHTMEIPCGSAETIGRALESVGAKGLFKAIMSGKVRGSEHSPCLAIAGNLDERSNSVVICVRPAGGDNGTRHEYRLSLSKECREGAGDFFRRFKEEIEGEYGVEEREQCGKAVSGSKNGSGSVVSRRPQAKEILSDETVLALALEHVRSLEDLNESGFIMKNEAVAAIAECALGCSAQGALEFIVSKGFLRLDILKRHGKEISSIVVTPAGRKFLSRFLTSTEGEEKMVYDPLIMEKARKVAELEALIKKIPELEEDLSEIGREAGSLHLRQQECMREIGELERILKEKSEELAFLQQESAVKEGKMAQAREDLERAVRLEVSLRELLSVI